MKIHLAITLAAALLAGCGNKNESTQPKTAPAAPPMTAKDAQPIIVPPPPPPPKATDDGVQRPTPGQANDDSTPSFKGGAPDPKK